MRSPARRLALLRSFAVAAAAGGVLIGLLGMHLLGLHGVQHEAASHAVVAGLDHHHAAADAPAGCCEHGTGTDALMLCLAMIVAAGVLLLGVGRDRALVLLDRVRSRPGGPPRLPLARAGPSYLVAYSVIRC